MRLGRRGTSAARRVVHKQLSAFTGVRTSGEFCFGTSGLNVEQRAVLNRRALVFYHRTRFDQVADQQKSALCSRPG